MAQQNKKIKVFDGRYEILSVVGRGECSVVYKVKLIAPPRVDAALKVLVNKDGEGSNIDKLRKEALAMVSSRHRYVIRLDDFHSFNDICYLCMEYAPHNSMRLYSEKIGGKLPINQAEIFLSQMLEALSFIHDVGIVHRDIKPDNLLVVSEEEARLADFGIAVLPGEESSLEELQKGVGTMDYMAPEVFQAKSCSVRSDVYCMGVTFYEMLSGVQPFNGAPLAKLLEIRRDKNITPISELVPNIPPYLSNIIMRAMSFDEKARFENGTDMLEEFQYAKSQYSNELSDPVVLTDQASEEANDDYQSDNSDNVEEVEQSTPEENYSHYNYDDDQQDTFNDDDDQQDTFNDDDSNTFSDDDDDDVIFGEETLDLHNAAKYQQVSPNQEFNDSDSFDNDETVVISPSELQESIDNGRSAYHDEDSFDDNATIPIKQPEMFNSNHQTLGPSNAKAWQEAHAAVNEYEEDGTLMVDDLPNEEEFEDDPRVGIEEHGFDFINASLRDDGQMPDQYTSNPAPIDDHGNNNHLPKLLMIFIPLLLIYGIFFSGIFSSNSSEEGVSESQIAALRPTVEQEAESELSQSPIQSESHTKAQVQNIQFPNLPAGIYSGQINNFFPGISVPLSFISLPGEESIAVIVGIDGWTATKVHINPEKKSKNFKVRANGMVLVFTPSDDDGLRGSFENQVTHDKGSWEAYPINVKR